MGSLITAVFVYLGVVYSAKIARDKDEALQDARMLQFEEKNKMTFDRIEEKIVELTKAQSKHNNLMERTFLLEKMQGEMSRDMKTLYNNINEVKQDVKEMRSDIESIERDVAAIKQEEIRLEGKINK